MALLTPVDPNLVGVVPNLVAVGASDTWQNNGKQILHVKNTSGVSTTVTIDDPQSRSPSGALSFNPDVQMTVAAGAEKYMGPFDPNRFNDPLTGIAVVTCSPTTGITIEVIDCA